MIRVDDQNESSVADFVEYTLVSTDRNEQTTAKWYIWKFHLIYTSRTMIEVNEEKVLATNYKLYVRKMRASIQYFLFIIWSYFELALPADVLMYDSQIPTDDYEIHRGIDEIRHEIRVHIWKMKFIKIPYEIR